MGIFDFTPTKSRPKPKPKPSRPARAYVPVVASVPKKAVRKAQVQDHHGGFLENVAHGVAKATTKQSMAKAKKREKVRVKRVDQAQRVVPGLNQFTAASLVGAKDAEDTATNAYTTKAAINALVHKWKLREDGHYYKKVSENLGLTHAWVPVDPITGKRDRKHQASKVGQYMAAEDLKKAEVTAPGLKILEQTTRPIHAVAGAADALVTGRGLKGAEKGFVGGLVHNDYHSFTDVFKHAGAPNAVAQGAGLLADIGLDVTTYASGGRAVPGEIAARKAAQAAGESALKKAAEGGLTRSAAKKAASKEARRAYTEAIAKHGSNKGLTLGLRAKVPFTQKHLVNVRTSGKTTAKISRATHLSGGATRVRNTNVVQRVGRTLAPDFRPKDVSQRVHTADLATKRKRDAAVRAGVGHAERTVHAVTKAAPGDKPGILAAVEGAYYDEHGNFVPIAKPKEGEAMVIPPEAVGRAHPGQLKGNDRKVARLIQKRNAEMGATEKEAGLLGTLRHRYAAHILAEDVTPHGPQMKGRASKLSAAQKRKDPRPLANAAAHAAETETEMPFSQNPAKVLGTRQIKHVKAMADTQYLKDLATHVGRPLTLKSAGSVGAEEAIYLIGNKSFTEIHNNANDIKKALATKGHKAVILPKRIGAAEVAGRLPGDMERGPSIYADRAVGAWKSAVTVANVPAYDLRNLYGDLQNAYLGHTDSRSISQGARLSGSLTRDERAQRSLDKGRRVAPGSLNLGKKYGKVDRDELLRWAIEDGVPRSGYSAEQQALSRATTKGGAKMTGFRRFQPRPIAGLRGIGQAREDSVRLGTYIAALKRGMTRTEARDWVNKHHFNYLELTPAEEKARRYAFPFYTFTARNTRLQVSKLTQEPGKFANIQKVREHAARIAGLPPGWEGRDLKDYQQRGLPIPIKVGGKVRTLYLTLPAQDLGRIPNVTLPPVEMAQQQANLFGQMVNPFVKSVAELGFNHSFFFQGPIYRDAANPKVPRWVPAPSWAAMLPDKVKRAIDYVPSYGKDSKPGWSPIFNYVMTFLPQGGLVTQLGTSGPGAHGQTNTQKWVSQATGIKVSDLDTAAATKAKDAAYTQVGKWDGQLQDMIALHQAYRPNGSRTPKYQALLDKKREYQKAHGMLKVKKVDPTLQKYGLGGATDIDKLAKKYGVGGASNLDALADKYGVGAP